jgi:DNA mismatch repair protein MutS
MPGKKDTLIQLYYTIERESKEKYGEKTIVLLQKGKFYELYSINPEFPKICDMMGILCSRVDKKANVPVCLTNPHFAGFPLTSIDRFINILLEKNYTIVVVDEVGVKQKNVNLTREITRVISPSTYIESNNNEIENLLFVIYKSKNTIALSHVNLSTGSIVLYPEDVYDIKIIRNLMTKINPREIIMYFDNTKELEEYNDLKDIKKNIIEKEIIKVNYQNEFLNTIYKSKVIGITPIENFNLERLQLTSTVLVLLLNFAIDHDKLLINNLKNPELISEDQLLLSENTILQLHLQELIKFINKFSKTAMGQRLIKDRILNPSTNSETLIKRYDSIKLLINNENKYESSIKKLSRIRDLEKFQRRISTLKLQSQELIHIYSSLILCKDVLTIHEISQITINNLNKIIKQFEIKINLDVEVIEDQEIGKIFKDNVHGELDKLYNEKRELNDEFEQIRQNICKSDKGELLKVGNCNKELYLIAKKDRSGSLKKNDPLLSVKGVSGEYRIRNKRIDEISKRLNEIEAELIIKNKEYFIEFCTFISDKYSKTLIKVSKLIAEIDINFVGYNLIKKCRFNMPKINEEGNNLYIEKIRHPLIESQISTPYIENDLNMDKNLNGMLLFGLNFSGKSSFLRSVGINIILAQAGLPTATTNMKFTPFKNFITKIALTDNMNRQESLFTNELKIVKSMLEAGNENTIILSDENYSSTEHISAVSLMASTLINLTIKNVKFIFTTHLHELLELEEIKKLKTVKAYHMNVSITDKLIFDRFLLPGTCLKLYGNEIASHMGLPTNFIYDANLIRNKLINESIVSTKKSRYNNSIYLTECKLCKATENLQTHHIIHQKDFSVNDVTKHYKSNLVVICESCHIKLHKNEININKYIDTSDGPVMV